MYKKLTEKQKNILSYIDYEIQQGLPPTYEEIANKFNITKKGAYDHVKAIEKKGYIRRDGRSRGMFICQK